MEIKEEIILDSATSEGCFSIRKQNYIDFNGQRNNIGLPERHIFCPGEFDELKEYAPKFEVVAKAIWTPEVILAWQEKQDESQRQLNAMQLKEGQTI